MNKEYEDMPVVYTDTEIDEAEIDAAVFEAIALEIEKEEKDGNTVRTY